MFFMWRQSTTLCSIMSWRQCYFDVKISILPNKQNSTPLHRIYL